MYIVEWYILCPIASRTDKQDHSDEYDYMLDEFTSMTIDSILTGGPAIIDIYVDLFRSNLESLDR